MRWRVVNLMVLLVIAAPPLAVGLTGEAARTPTWTGRWFVDHNSFRGSRTFFLTQKGTSVTGRHGLLFLAETVQNGLVLACQTRAGGKIKGTVRGRKLTGTITFPNAQGVLYLTLSSSGREIVGQLNIVRGPCKSAWGAFNPVRL